MGAVHDDLVAFGDTLTARQSTKRRAALDSQAAGNVASVVGEHNPDPGIESTRTP